MQEYHSCVWVTYCRKEVVPGRAEGCRNINHSVYISYLLQEGGVYLDVQKGAGISLLCVWVTYCRKEEGLPGRAEGCRNITSLHVGFLLQEGGCTWRFRRVQEYHSSVCGLLTAGRKRVYLVEQKGAGISLLCMWVSYCRKEEGVPGGLEGCRNITPVCG